MSAFKNSLIIFFIISHKRFLSISFSAFPLLKNLNLLFYVPVPFNQLFSQLLFFCYRTNIFDIFLSSPIFCIFSHIFHYTNFKIFLANSKKTYKIEMFRGRQPLKTQNNLQYLGQPEGQDTNLLYRSIIFLYQLYI